MIKKRLILTAIVMLFFVACQKDIIDTNTKGNLVTVSVNLSGDVLTSDEPLTKSLGEDDLLGIQVYQGNEPYAYGLFDNTDDISINLHTGGNYSFKAQLIKRGKEELQLLGRGNPNLKFAYFPEGNMRIITVKDPPYPSYTLDTYSSYHISKYICYLTSDKSRVYYLSADSGFGEPFCFAGITPPNRMEEAGTGWYEYLIYTRNSINYYYFENYDKIPYQVSEINAITNSFVYSQTRSMNITSSFACAKNPDSVDKYYGELSSYPATKEKQPISIDLKHIVYGLQCNVTGITDGAVSITIKNNSDSVLFSRSEITSDYSSDNMLFSCSDLPGAWLYSDNYAENITISMSWLRGVGVLQDLGSRVIQVKRNCINVINVSLSTSSGGAAMSVKN